MSMPLVGVASTKFVEGANSLQDQGLVGLATLPLDEALRSSWPTDAHFVIYQLARQGQIYSGWPRCNKPCLDSIRSAGAYLQVPFVALDYDNPGHQPWTKEWKDSFERRVLDASNSGLRAAMSWTYLYYTRGGARLIYVLSQPVQPEQAEGLVLGLVRDFLAYGIEMDPLADWTRLFRLPRVVRDGQSSDRDPFFELVEQPENTLDPASVVPGERVLSSKYSGLQKLAAPQPDPDWCRSALYEKDLKTGRMKRTWWYRQAKKWLQGRESFPCLFEGAPLADRGSRNSNIQKMVGEAVSILYRSCVQSTTAELVYALFFESLEQLNAEDPHDPEDFLVTGWKAVLQYWSKEEAKYRAEQEELQKQQKEFLDRQKSLTSRVLAGAREWASDIPKSEADAAWWLGEHLIAATSGGFHVMTASGYYDPIPVNKQMVMARVRELRMHPLIPLEKMEEGKLKPVTPQEVIDRHATAINSSEGAIGLKGTLVRNVGKGNATLVHRLFGRKNLEPKWDQEVDAWMQMLAGENYHALCDWVAHALDFEGGPICALSMKGHPGCGKKLFYQGLAECIDTERTASGLDLGQYQGGLLSSPFLVVNEGLHASRGGMHVADLFRHLVSGDPLYVNEKYRVPVLIRVPVRVLFLANNLDVVQALTGNRDLSPEDREALALRIFHFDVDASASIWLRNRGGLAFTRGWISGDSGTRSSYRVARHFMFLYKNRPPMKEGNRLLMEGNITDELIRQMSTRSGSAPVVIETLIRMVETDSYLEGFHIEGARIFVTTSAVVDYFRSGNMGLPSHTLNHKTVGRVLRGLIVAGSSTKPREIDTARGRKKAKWREIDTSILLEEAVEHGYQCRKLERVAASLEVLKTQARSAISQMHSRGVV